MHIRASLQTRAGGKTRRGLVALIVAMAVVAFGAGQARRRVPGPGKDGTGRAAAEA